MERSKNYTRVVESVGRLRKKHSYEYHGLAQFITFDRYAFKKLKKLKNVVIHCLCHYIIEL